MEWSLWTRIQVVKGQGLRASEGKCRWSVDAYGAKVEQVQKNTEICRKTHPSSGAVAKKRNNRSHPAQLCPAVSVAPSSLQTLANLLE